MILDEEQEVASLKLGDEFLMLLNIEPMKKYNLCLKEMVYNKIASEPKYKQSLTIFNGSHESLVTNEK